MASDSRAGKARSPFPSDKAGGAVPKTRPDDAPKTKVQAPDQTAKDGMRKKKKNARPHEPQHSQAGVTEPEKAQHSTTGTQNIEAATRGSEHVGGGPHKKKKILRE